MHSSVELKSADFAIFIDGVRASLGELIPGFTEQTRLGVIIRHDFGAVGASSFLMAAITGFFDIQREQHPEGFFRYPDFFLLNVGRIRGHCHMLDVFPAHKEVVVPDDPEEILRAVNDRGITHLLVPDARPVEADFKTETIGSASHRIKGAFIYSPDGRVPDADVEIGANERVDYYVWATLRAADWLERDVGETVSPTRLARLRARFGEVPDEVAESILASRDSLKRKERTVESFRQIDVEKALRMLSPNPVAEPQDQRFEVVRPRVCAGRSSR